MFKNRFVGGFAIASLFFLIFTSISSSAEDDFSVPGLDPPTVTTPPAQTGGSGDATTPGGAAEEEKNLFDMLLDGGWAMIPLALMSLVIIGLAIYMLIDLTKRNFVPPALIAQLNGSKRVQPRLHQRCICIDRPTGCATHEVEHGLKTYCTTRCHGC